jgi:hypothetical protein
MCISFRTSAHDGTGESFGVLFVTGSFFDTAYNEIVTRAAYPRRGGKPWRKNRRGEIP